MKKVLHILLYVYTTALFCSCGRSTAGKQADVIEQDNNHLEEVLESKEFIVEPKGVNDTLGVYLRPEYTVYSTETKQVTFILYNKSRDPVYCGEHYDITYEDAEGVWHDLSLNGLAFDMAHSIESGGYRAFTASLHPDVYRSRAGNYRFFYKIYLGDLGFATATPLMVGFRLSDDEKEWGQAVKTPVPKAVLGGLSEQEYHKQEEHKLETHVFTVVEQMPEFPDGGQSGLWAFIAYNTSKNITQEGRAVISFTVERDGTLNDICLLRSSLHKELDEEAIRIVKRMPKWIPGKHRDRNVRVKYTIPVRFPTPFV